MCLQSNTGRYSLTYIALQGLPNCCGHIPVTIGAPAIAFFVFEDDALLESPGAA